MLVEERVCGIELQSLIEIHKSRKLCTCGKRFFVFYQGAPSPINVVGGLNSVAFQQPQTMFLDFCVDPANFVCVSLESMDF